MTNVPLKSEKKEVEGGMDENSDSSNEQMVPKARLDEVIKQREEALAKLKEASTSGNNSEIQELKDEIKELKDLLTKKEPEEDFDETEKNALSKIKKGISDEFATKAEMKQWLQEQEDAKNLAQLSDKYKKGSGFPEFKADEVIVYAKKKGFGNNYEAAYRDMNWEGIVQATAKGVEPPDSEKPTGQKTATTGEITVDKIRNMTDEDWDKHGDSIFKKFKESIFKK